MPHLLFLDLSYTMASEMIATELNALSFPSLRVLKLRGLRLTDQKLQSILHGRHLLWSLDVRENLLTDTVTEALLPFLRRRTPRPESLDWSQEWELYDNPPFYARHEGTHEVEDGFAHDEWKFSVPYRPDDKEAFMKYFETNGRLDHRGRRWLNDDDPLYRETGLTHLYISGNKLSCEGIQGLIAHTGSLHAFDVGSVLWPNARIGVPEMQMPYAQLNIGRYLPRSASNFLTRLRVHHSIVTYTPTIRLTNKNEYTLESLELAESVGASIRDKTSPHRCVPFVLLTNFRLKSLTLCDVPTKSYGFVLQELKTLLSRCRVQEQTLAEAKKAQGNQRRAPQLLTGLETLRLEFVPLHRPTVVALSSVSGDTDADAFLASTAGDFSFFGEAESSKPTAPSLRSQASSFLGSSRPSTSSSSAASRPASASGGEPKQKRRWWKKEEGKGKGKVKGKEIRRVEPAEPERVLLDVVDELKQFRKGEERWGGKLEIVFPFGR